MARTFGEEMKILKHYFKLHAWAVKHQCLRGQLLFAGLIGYGFLIALPASEFVSPIAGWIASVIFLTIIGYLLRKNVWNEGAEAIRIFGVSLIPLLVIALLLSTTGNSDAFLLTQFFPLVAMALIPLWLPFGVGILVGEIQSRRSQRALESFRSPNLLNKNRTEHVEDGKAPPAIS